MEAFSIVRSALAAAAPCHTKFPHEVHTVDTLDNTLCWASQSVSRRVQTALMKLVPLFWLLRWRPMRTRPNHLG